MQVKSPTDSKLLVYLLVANAQIIVRMRKSLYQYTAHIEKKAYQNIYIGEVLPSLVNCCRMPGNPIRKKNGVNTRTPIYTLLFG